MSKNFALIVGEFHEEEALIMEKEAIDVISSHGHQALPTFWVPGTYELPIALKIQLMRDDVHAAVILGIIERGETSHGIVMANSVMPKILDIQLEFMKPIGVGILGPDIFPSQIDSRVISYSRKASETAVIMINRIAEVKL